MSERLDALTVREYTDRNGNKKSSWTKIGSAWINRDGGYSIILDALPLPTMGERGMETRIILKVPKQDKAPASAHPSQFATDRSGYGEQQSSYGDAPADLDDDDLPF